MKNEEQEYTPFGSDWTTEMMKFSKPLLIEILKKSLLYGIELREKHADLKDRYNDLLFDNCDW